MLQMSPGAVGPAGQGMVPLGWRGITISARFSLVPRERPRNAPLSPTTRSSSSAVQGTQLVAEVRFIHLYSTDLTWPAAVSRRTNGTGVLSAPSDARVRVRTLAKV